MTITLYREGDLWVATIFGGWWVGHGKTAKAAVASTPRRPRISTAGRRRAKTTDCPLA